MVHELLGANRSFQCSSFSELCLKFQFNSGTVRKGSVFYSANSVQFRFLVFLNGPGLIV